MKRFLSLFLLLVLTLLPAVSAANQVLYGPPVSVSVTDSSALALSANSLRTYLIIVNTGSNPAIVKFGSAQSGTEGIPIPAGGNYEPYKAPANSVYVKTASSTTTLQIIQGN